MTRAPARSTWPNSTQLDYETTTSYSLTVKVTDNGLPVLFGTGVISIEVNDVDEAPMVIDESYETIGNTLLEVTDGTAGPAPRIVVDGNVLANDVDPEDDGALTAGLVSGISANGGSVSMNADGTFTYLPPVGQQGEDSFDYTVTDVHHLSATGTVSITIQAMVWYVKNNAPAGGDGRSTSPFNVLTSAEATSQAGSTVYLFAGDGTATGQNAGIALKNDQRLIGAGVALDFPIQLNGGDATTQLLPGSSQPLLDNLSGDGVTISNLTAAEVRGLSLAGSVHAINVTASGSASAVVTIQDNTVRSAGTAGVYIRTTSTGTIHADVQGNTLTATGNAFDAQNNGTGKLSLQFNDNGVTSSANGVVIANTAGGSTTITAFENNAVDQNTVGSGMILTGVIFDAIEGGAYQTVQGGSTRVGSTGNGVGAAGMTLSNVRGDLLFNDLDIIADGGSGLRVSSSAIFNAASATGFQLAVLSGAGSLAATGGPAVDANTVTLDLPLASLGVVSSPTTGVSLNNVLGTVSALGGSIGATLGTAFDVISGNGNVTYPGTITNSFGKAVSVVSHSGGTVTFSGAIADTGAGVFLNSNTGTVIHFSGGLNLTTGSNPAFTATNGGTVDVSGSTNTLTTTTGMALNVANTAIGGDNLTFRSISANGAATGILLNSTGAFGGLKITGTGAAGSGGTLQHTTSDCVSLTNTAAVEINYLNTLYCGDIGIDASSVNDFIFRNGAVQNTGNANDEHGMRLVNLSGTVLIQDTTISSVFENGISLTNTSGSLDMMVRRTTISQNDNAHGEDGLQLRLGSTATAKLLVDDSDFNNLQRDGIDAVVEGGARLDLTVQNGSTFTGNSGNGSNTGVNLSSNNTAVLHADLIGNIFQSYSDTPLESGQYGGVHF